MTMARDEGYEVVEATLSRSDLYLADEAWFTGTAAEMVPLVEVDDRAVGAGVPCCADATVKAVRPCRLLNSPRAPKR